MDVFKDVAAYPCIITLSPKEPMELFDTTLPKSLDFSDLDLYIKSNKFSVETSFLKNSGWALVDRQVSSLVEKIVKIGTPLNDIIKEKIFYGIKTGLNDAFVITKEIRDNIVESEPKAENLIKPFLAGRDIKRYSIDFQETYLILIPNGWTNLNKKDKDGLSFFSEAFPVLFKYLSKFELKAKKRSDKGDYW